MPPLPRIARRTLPLLEAPSGVIVVAMTPRTDVTPPHRERLDEGEVHE
jgi:hypothetical protein